MLNVLVATSVVRVVVFESVFRVAGGGVWWFSWRPGGEHLEVHDKVDKTILPLLMVKHVFWRSK